MPFAGDAPKCPATVMIYLDSRDRNTVAYPDPSSYVYKLPETIRNAYSIELMMFQMVRTDPVINSSNNQFTIIVNNVSYTCTLPIGDITTFSQLATIVQTALNAISIPGSPSWTVTVSSLGFLTISASSTAFQIVMNQGVAVLLGIKAQYASYTSSSDNKPVTGLERGAGITLSNSSNSIIAAHQADINGDPYALLFVNDYFPSVSVNSFLETAFMMLPLENTTYNNRFLLSNDLKEKKNMYVLGNHQSRIDTLRISLTRPDGSAYMTNGIDHQIVFRITLRDAKEYTS
jgi:hypothetical protein